MTSNNSDIPTAIKERDRETGYPGYSSDPDTEAVDKSCVKVTQDTLVRALMGGNENSGEDTGNVLPSWWCL